MRTCMQFGTMDVLEHGRQVTEAFRLLLEALSTGELPAGWRIPGWLQQHAEVFLSRLLPLETLYAYQLYHDCGKPLCRITDAEGRPLPRPRSALRTCVAGGTGGCRYRAADWLGYGDAPSQC